jgi:hypothetical protein
MGVPYMVSFAFGLIVLFLFSFIESTHICYKTSHFGVFSFWISLIFIVV